MNSPATQHQKTTSARLLEGRHAIVSGGGRGIGAAIAERLAGLGADLTLIGRNAATLERAGAALAAAHGVRTYEAVADVTEAPAVQSAIAAAAAKLGAPWLIVNNAGIAESTPFVKMTDEHWRRTLDVNLTGTFHGCRAVVPMMLAAGGGRIVNIASTAGQVGYAYVAAYCAAKHGVIGLTRALALELAKKNITVNAVCPGYTESDMTVETIRNIVAKTGRSEADARAELARLNPQGRLIQPEEVAAVVGWLALPEAASVNGQAIAVAGGEVMP